MIDNDAALPEISISSQGDVTEGSPAVFTLTRTGDTARELVVGVDFVDNRTLIAGFPEGETGRDVTFPVGDATVALSIATEDDDIAELTETLQVEIIEDAAYSITTGQAELAVADNDPLVVRMDPPEVVLSEGGSRRVLVRFGPNEYDSISGGFFHQRRDDPDFVRITTNMNRTSPELILFRVDRADNGRYQWRPASSSDLNVVYAEGR